MSTPGAALQIPAGLSYSAFLEWLDDDVRSKWVGGEVIRAFWMHVSWLWKTLSPSIPEIQSICNQQQP